MRKVARFYFRGFSGLNNPCLEFDVDRMHVPVEIIKLIFHSASWKPVQAVEGLRRSLPNLNFVNDEKARFELNPVKFQGSVLADLIGCYSGC
jgi:hypothetical protein